MNKVTKRYRIFTPVAGFTGYIGVVAFLDGHAEIEVDIDDAPFDADSNLSEDDQLKLRVMRAAPAMAYFWPQGYGVEDITPAPAKSAAKTKETPA